MDENTVVMMTEQEAIEGLRKYMEDTGKNQTTVAKELDSALVG